jgi:hypothetical protein
VFQHLSFPYTVSEMECQGQRFSSNPMRAPAANAKSTFEVSIIPDFASRGSRKLLLRQPYVGERLGAGFW